MVAGSGTTKGVTTLLGRATSTAGTVPLFAESHGVGTNVEKPAAQPYRIEEGSDDRQSNHGKHRPEERTRNPWNDVHVSNNAQGW